MPTGLIKYVMKRKQNYFDDVPSAQGGGNVQEVRKNARSALNYVAGDDEERKIDTIKPVRFDIKQFLNDYFK